jgi:hypothetical protein
MTPIDQGNGRPRAAMGGAARAVPSGPSGPGRSRRQRARRLRRSVIAGAVTLFVTAWLLIAVVLASGHDPALAAQTATTTKRLSTAQTVATTPTSGSTASGSTSSGSAAISGATTSGATTSASGVSGVTTRQS